MSGDHHLIVVEQLFAAFRVAWIAQVGVATQLADALRHGIGDEGGLALHHCQRQPIHEEGDVGNDSLGRTLNLELVNAKELVVLWDVKVNEFDRLPTATTAQILINTEVLGETFPEPLICLHQRGGLNQGDFTDHLAEVFPTDPGIDALDGLLQAGSQHHVSEG